MEQVKITKEEVKALKLQCINRMIILEPVFIDTGSSIVLPDSKKDAMNAAGGAMLQVTHVAEDCEKIRVGDFVIMTPDAKMGKFEIIDDEYVMCNEEGVGFIMRPQPPEGVSDA